MGTLIGKIQFYIAREMHENADCPYFCRKMLSLPEKNDDSSMGKLKYREEHGDNSLAVFCLLTPPVVE